ncbi:MAG: nucleotidyltransferase domain-containing protein [Campylobacterota bacterium]|nr:nucleotidyltransferase domain-containing protein [Campylobacterota bacterium]
MDIIKTLETKLLHMDTVRFGYLFGSFSDNTFTSSSDIDIALYLDNTSYDTQAQIIYELSKLLKKDIDLVVLNNIKNIYLLENIIIKGIVLKDNNNRYDFELIKQHDILDFKAFRKFIDAA